MTTNHRPTFESRRGRQLEQTSIVHKRALPAHTQLKFRHVDGKEARQKLEELKRELEEREDVHGQEKKNKSISGTRETEPNTEKETETFAQKRRRIQLENADESDADDSAEDEDASDSEDADGSEDESDSDSDSEALLLELRKIKEEKAEKLRKLEQEQRREAALTSNPLLNQSGAKKSWRQATVFRNASSSAKPKEENDSYVNDALRSDFHKKFLDRYIK